MAARQTATRFGNTRGWGHVLAGPCILKQINRQTNSQWLLAYCYNQLLGSIELNNRGGGDRCWQDHAYWNRQTDRQRLKILITKMALPLEQKLHGCADELHAQDGWIHLEGLTPVITQGNGKRKKIGASTSEIYYQTEKKNGNTNTNWNWYSPNTGKRVQKKNWFVN